MEVKVKAVSHITGGVDSSWSYRYWVLGLRPSGSPQYGIRYNTSPCRWEGTLRGNPAIRSVTNSWRPGFILSILFGW